MRVPLKLLQKVITDSVTTLYTAPTKTRTQVTEIWIANTGNVQRKVTLYAHGTALANTLAVDLVIEPRSTKLIDNSKIVLLAGEVLAANQNVDSDVVITAYGIEEGVE